MANPFCKYAQKGTGNMKKQIILKIGIGIGILTTVICIGITGYYIVTLSKSQDKYQQLQEQMQTVSGSEPIDAAEMPESEAKAVTEVQPAERSIDFDSLQEQENEDIYAWIEVEGTTIDYPILQHPTDDQYYLIHNLDHSYGYPGCIFTERVAKKDFSNPVTVVYGHRMKNGTMFAQLHEFENEDFFEEHGDITIYTAQENHYYQVIAAFVTNDRKLTYIYDFDKPEILQGYLEEVYAMQEGKGNHVKQEIPVTAENRFLILETCTAQSRDKRYVVMAIEVAE